MSSTSATEIQSHIIQTNFKILTLFGHAAIFVQ